MRSRSLFPSDAATSVGVISDTHGPVRREAIEALAGSDLIIHAGDVGDPRALDQLRELAPTFAVRGNNDRAAWAMELPLNEVVEVGRHLFYVLHEIEELDLDPVAAEISVVISGHSHKPDVEQRGEVLYLNPGSAGPRRFKLPIALARVEATDERITSRIIELEV
jgi:putative phosphoesterase